MTILTMFDAVTPTNIPTNVQAVAGYLNGLYVWTSNDWDRFPNALKKTISVFANADVGDVLDCENGDATPAQCPGWIRMRQASGLAKPTIYCNTSSVGAVNAACAGLDYWIWTAHYTNQAHIEVGSIATQYADPGPVDLSLADSSWWGPEAIPAPVPTVSNLTNCIGLAPSNTGKGYALTEANGHNVYFGDMANQGDLSSQTLNKPIVTVSSPSKAPGYYMFASDGGVFDFGSVPFHGSLGNVTLNSPIVDGDSLPDASGYYMVGSDGGVFNFGNAPFKGSLGNVKLNKPVVGIAPSNGGYWVAAADGGVFQFGLPFFGSAGNVTLNAPIVDIAAHPSGQGYWLVGADGGVFNFGIAAFMGSLGSVKLNKPIVRIESTPDGNGYWLVAADGGVFNFGNAAFEGAGT